MKYFFILCISIFALNYSISFSQDLFLANDGLEFLKNSTDEIKDKKLIQIQAIQSPNAEGSEVNFKTGQGNLWNYAFISNDTKDQKLYIYTVYKEVGDFKYEPSTDEQYDYQSIVTPISSDWKNSDLLGKEIENNNEFLDYEAKNKDVIIVKIMMLIVDTGIEAWEVANVISQTDMGLCVYKSTTLERISCTFATDVNEKLASNFKLFPTPAKETITINAPIEGNVSYEVFNSIGLIVKSGISTMNNELNLDINDLSNGYYIIKMIDNQNTYTEKFLIQR